MKIHFRGANREVTGSRHLLEINGKKILLDCGLYQGRRKDEKERIKTFSLIQLSSMQLYFHTRILTILVTCQTL